MRVVNARRGRVLAFASVTLRLAARGVAVLAVLRGDSAHIVQEFFALLFSFTLPRKQLLMR